MEVEFKEPPDKGGSEEGAGPGLPGPPAAAVKASLQEGREAEPLGGHQPGEEVIRMETAAAAVVRREAGGAGVAQGEG